MSALLAAGCLSGIHSAAQTLPGTPVSDVTAMLPSARLLGSTRLNVWGFDVYDARLFVTPGFRAEAYAQSPFALELRYLRAFTGKDIAQRSIDEMRRSGAVSDAQAAQWLREMVAMFPDVKKGDSLVGVYQPGSGVRFVYNGVPRGTVGDATFALRFVGIWLSPQTSEPSMRAALLALAD